jgi:hypothetical protein
MVFVKNPITVRRPQGCVILTKDGSGNSSVSSGISFFRMEICLSATSSRKTAPLVAEELTEAQALAAESVDSVRECRVNLGVFAADKLSSGR